MRVGDEGINRGAQWFILTAIIVPKSYDLTLSDKLLNIKKYYILEYLFKIA